MDRSRLSAILLTVALVSSAGAGEFPPVDARPGAPASRPAATGPSQGSARPDTLSVRDFGAACDGVTDDTSAVQAALAALTANQVLTVDGICAVGARGWTGRALNRKHGISIVGRTRGCGFKVQFAPSQTLPGKSTYYHLLLATACNDLTISGLTVNLNQVSNTGGFGLSSCSRATISQNYIYNGFPGAGTGTPEDRSCGVASIAGQYNKYLNNEFYRCGHALWIGNGNTGNLEYYAVISGNTCHGGFATAVAPYTVHSVVSNNVIYDNAGSGIVVGADLAGVDFTRDTILTGNYIRGNAFQGIQFDWNSSPPVTWTNIEVSNNIILENQHNGIFVTHARYCAFSNNLIHDNAQYDKGDSGIFVEQSSDCTFTGNYCYNTSGARQQGYGIRFVSTSPADFQNCTVTGNTCNQHQYSGLEITCLEGTVGTMSIVGNTCNGNTNGIYAASQLSGYTFSGNTALNNSNQDIRLYGASFKGNLGQSFDGLAPIEAANRHTAEFGTTPPRGGTYQRGSIVWNAEAAPGGYAGWICTSSGTMGQYAEGLTAATNGTTTVTLSGATTVLKPGQWITINGQHRLILSITGRTLLVAGGAVSPGSGQPIAFHPATWSTFGSVSDATLNPKLINGEAGTLRGHHTA